MTAIPPAIVEAIDRYGTAQWAFGGGQYRENCVPVCQDAKQALVAAIADALQEAEQNAAHAAVYAAFDVLNRRSPPR